MANPIAKEGRRKSSTSECRFLLVDDHDLVRFGLTQLISQVPGWEVCGESADVSTALRLVREQSPTLAIVDLSLKEGSGLDLIKQLTQSHPEIRVLVLSMHDEALYAERALRAGAQGYVHKQQPARVVLSAIRRILDGKTYLSPEQTERMLSRATGRTAGMGGSPIEMLSDRELQVFELIGRGSSVKQIAEELHVSTKTVEYHRDHIKEKLGATNSADVTRQATIWMMERD